MQSNCLYCLWASLSFHFLFFHNAAGESASSFSVSANVPVKMEVMEEVRFFLNIRCILNIFVSDQEDNRENCRWREGAKNSALDGHSRHGTEDDTEDSEDYEKETGQTTSLKTSKNERVTTGENGSISKPNLPKNHLVQKAFSCSNCGKGFVKKNKLKVHERIHTGEKPLSCPECGKGFIQKSDLRKHKRIHTREKPFSCYECGQTYTEKSTLKIHERIHTGEKPYSCSKCGKTFTTKSNLNIHEKVHTGEKPYSCIECGRIFIQQSRLKTHEQL